LCIVDFIVAASCFIVCVLEFMPKDKEERRIVSALKIVMIQRIIRTFRLFWQLRSCPCLKSVRKGVSKNRRRFVDYEEEFDLDLTYITPATVAMSCPANSCLTSIYRNPLQEVGRFFETYHSGKYLIVNCCPELPYSTASFPTGKFHKFDIQDHTPPTMAQFVEYIQLVDEFLSIHPANVFAVHCKGGKGRTGSLLVAYLLYSRQCENLADALHTFALARSDLAHRGSLQGVETPSQVRYLWQFGQLLEATGYPSAKSLQPPPDTPVALTALNFQDVWRMVPPRRMVVAVHKIRNGSESRVLHWTPEFDGKADSVSLGGFTIGGDIRLSIFDRDKVREAREKSNVGLAFSGDARTSVTNTGVVSGCSGATAPKCIAGDEPGCMFYILLHTAYLDFSAGELTIGVGSGKLLNGLDKAHNKKNKYNVDSGYMSLRFQRPT